MFPVCKVHTSVLHCRVVITKRVLQQNLDENCTGTELKRQRFKKGLKMHKKLSELRTMKKRH